MKTATRRYARRQLTWLRKLPGVQRIDVTGRDAGRRRRGDPRRAAMMRAPMRFEKWQALGNDYLIVEAAAAPVRADRRTASAGCATRTSGRARDGVLELSPPARPGFVARLRIFNPDGSEAELSGNGAREAILYLRRSGWTDADVFSIETAAGEIRPTITGPTTCRVDMGRARLTSKDFPAGRPRRPRRGRRLPLPARLDRQPAVRDPRRRPRDARGARPARDRPGDRARRRCSRTAPTSPSGPSSRPDRIRARIFERGVGETLSSGTGASGAAVAHVVRGGDSPVTVVLDGGELEVDVGEDLHVDLTGWAVPVYAGELSAELEPICATGLTPLRPATAWVRSASLSEVLRSVDADRRPMISAAGSW